VKPLAPFWHEFKHSIVVGIMPLHSWQLMTSHFHFYVTVESVAPAVWWKGQQSALCPLCAEYCIIWVLPRWNVQTCASSCSGTPLQSNETSMEFWAACTSKWGWVCHKLHVIFMNYLLNILHVQWLNWSTVCLCKVSILMKLHFCSICSVPFEEIQLFC